MINRFSNKSNSKRKKIFLARTEKLMLSLVKEFYQKTEYLVPPDEISATAKDLTSIVFEKTGGSLETILSSSPIVDFTQDELIDYLYARVQHEAT